MRRHDYHSNPGMTSLIFAAIRIAVQITSRDNLSRVEALLYDSVPTRASYGQTRHKVTQRRSGEAKCCSNPSGILNMTREAAARLNPVPQMVERRIEMNICIRYLAFDVKVKRGIICDDLEAITGGSAPEVSVLR